MPACAVCHKTEKDIGKPVLRCGKCKIHPYCGPQCQKGDWKEHKRVCKTPKVWYDRHRMCQDGHKHEGKLELITWNAPEEKAQYISGGLGWGRHNIDGADDLRKKFEVEFNSNEERFFDYWPQAFRWTCCGTHAGMNWGCDHHGSGSFPCSCDYCCTQQPLPEKIYNEKTASRMGLKLRRGPDLRSKFRGFTPPPLAWSEQPNIFGFAESLKYTH